MQNMYGGENYLHAHIHDTKDWQEYVLNQCLFKCSGCRCGGLWYRKNRGEKISSRICTWPFSFSIKLD